MVNTEGNIKDRLSYVCKSLLVSDLGNCIQWK